MDVADYNELPIAVLMTKQQLKALVDRLPDDPSDDLKRVGQELIYNDIMWRQMTPEGLALRMEDDAWIAEAMNLVAMLAARLTGLWEGGLDEYDRPVLKEQVAKLSALVAGE